MTRVLTFTNLFPSAAFPTHGLFVAERMRRVIVATGFDWQVVCPVPEVARPLRRGDYVRFAEMPDVEQVDGITVHHPRYRHLPGLSLRRQARSIARGAAELVTRLTSERPVVLDAHYVYPDGVAAVELGRRLGVRVLVTARGSDINVAARRPAVASQIREMARHAFALLAVGEPLRRRFAAVAGVDDGRVQLARNGVDLERFTPGDRAAARAELGLPASGPLIVGVGRLVRGKGFHFLAEAVAAIPGARLALVGDGPDRARIERAAGDRPVAFLGALPPDSVAAAYRASDVVALPSMREGWSNVVTEALACGRPVVASAVGAVPEILAGDGVGRCVPVGDVAALTAALRAFLQAPPDASKIREHAARFSWDQPVGLLADLLTRALR